MVGVLRTMDSYQRSKVHQALSLDNKQILGTHSQHLLGILSLQVQQEVL